MNDLKNDNRRMAGKIDGSPAGNFRKFAVMRRKLFELGDIAFQSLPKGRE